VETTVLVSVMGVLTVVAIYFVWVRKLGTKGSEIHQPKEA